ncbi:MAG: ABC transporter permease [Deltaproteobacteria bacterium]|nr:MAG: ABC transporter permease [Deltaproteobacteria bacterium]
MSREGTVVRDKAGFLERRKDRRLGVLTVLVVLGLWEAVGRSGWVSPFFLPPLTQVLLSGWEMTRSGEVFSHLAASLWRIGSGFAAGAGLGVLLGVALGFSQKADDAIHPLVAATYPVPKIAVLPLLILWLGIGEASKVAVIGLGVFFPVAINARAGVRNVDPLLVKAALSLGSGRWGVVRKVILPASLPMIFAGLKLGVGIALLLVVTAEMIAAESGVGFLILSAADLMQTTRLLFGIMLLSGLGLFLSWLLGRVERKLIPWRG